MSPVRRTFFVGAIVVVAASAIALGRWQLHRLAARRASNTVLAAAAQLPAAELPADLAAGAPLDSGRQVVARGHFDSTGQIILRGHAQDDGPGIQIVTPFLLDSTDRVLWVLRGFLHSPDAVTPPDPIPAPASGVVTLHGIAVAFPRTADSGAPLLHNGVTTYKRLDRGVAIARRAGSLDRYLLLNGDANGPGRLAVVPPVALSDGPHLSYALQWFGIALAVLTFGVIVLWRDGRALPPHREAP